MPQISEVHKTRKSEDWRRTGRRVHATPLSIFWRFVPKFVLIMGSGIIRLWYPRRYVMCDGRYDRIKGSAFNETAGTSSALKRTDTHPRFDVEACRDGGEQNLFEAQNCVGSSEAQQ